MEAGRPSQTALRVAVLRALHQRGQHPLVFDDPLAVAMIEPETLAAAEGRTEPDALIRHLGAWVVARARLAEDRLGDAVAAGVTQYVVLGAGLDSFAYRNPHAGLRVFELDHPDTQAWKRHRLAAAGIAIPDGMRFAPIDFATRPLGDALAEAGFDAGKPAFFGWLGVISYLMPAAITATLGFIANLPRGSGVIFDFISSSKDQPPPPAIQAVAERVASLGEPFRSTHDPDELAAELDRLGFTRIEIFDAEHLNQRYFTQRPDPLRVGRSGRIMIAWV